MAICKINLNEELNGIELLFDEKPTADTIASVKANGFRWSPKNKLWYAKNTAERLTFAQTLATSAPTACAASSIEVINLDNLGVKPSNFSYYGAELAKFIRDDLKKRGVKGVTVRKRDITYDTGITITIKATAEDFASIEESAERYDKGRFTIDLNRDLYINGRWVYMHEYEQMNDEEKEQLYYAYLSEQIKGVSGFSVYHQDRNRDAWTLTTAFYNKCMAVYQIANQWNYDHSDSMTDYFDVGYYLDIDIKHDDFEPRATMTDKERASLEAERQKEQEDFERWQKEQEEERKQREEESKKYNAWVEESTEIIFNDISIEDLDDSEQLFAVDIIGAWGKENSLQELREDIQTYYDDGKEPHNQNALISRIIRFKTADAFDRFSNMFLHDFPFIEGKGGTATEDIRINSGDDVFKLNNEQRETIDFYLCNCIAVYLDNELKYIIDPQGYSYSRYVYLADNCTLINAPEKLDQMRKESEDKAPFYFPAPIDEQINNISVGDNITVWQCDGWLLNKVLDGFGTVLAIESGTYAQYSGIYITLKQGRKEKRVFIRDNHDCLIYKGVNVLLPDEVKGRKISDTMTELYNYDVLLPNIYNYFKGQGIEPTLDTWQR